ncbi:MAG: helix-turn-helix transcriptional regulator [Thermoclostridium sp.]|nr:helix-turn-helix transcriptional regulator [Thermoclostridium sp.]
MDKQPFYETPCMQEDLFPFSISKRVINRCGPAFSTHWHEHIEFLYILDGEGIIECNAIPYHVAKSDLLLVNGSELHCGYSKSEQFSYYCMIMNPSVLCSSLIEICEVKYMNPIMENCILFQNLIRNDLISNCMQQIIHHFEEREIGFELSIKSQIYQLFAVLLKLFVRNTLSESAMEGRKNNLERLTPVMDYIEKNYHKKLSVQELAQLTNISYHRFCHLFKSVTGRTATDYINEIRINKAALLLGTADVTVTEAALESGYTDVSYFSRQFRKYKDITPISYKHQRKTT